MATNAQLENAMRKEILEVIVDALADHFDLDKETQIEFISSGTIVLPLVDKEGNEKYPKIAISIPRGTRDGEGGYIPFDGHAAAVAYKNEQASKAQEKAVKKAMKAAEKKKGKKVE